MADQIHSDAPASEENPNESDYEQDPQAVNLEERAVRKANRERYYGLKEAI